MSAHMIEQGEDKTERRRVVEAVESYWRVITDILDLAIPLHPSRTSPRHRQLQDLIGESESIPAELLERLLRERRILVIVDHFSEMINDTREEIQPAHPEFPFNALVFTSRDDKKLGVTSTIEPYRIEGNRLSSFMDSYLTFYKRRDEFTDVEFFDYCSQLSRMIGERKPHLS
jgi:hypothetical protein